MGDPSCLRGRFLPPRISRTAESGSGKEGPKPPSSRRGRRRGGGGGAEGWRQGGGEQVTEEDVETMTRSGKKTHLFQIFTP